MATYRNQIEEMVYEQKKLLMEYTEERDKYKAGGLACCLNHGKENYYLTRTEDGRYVRTSLNGKPEAVKELARKEYVNVACKALDKNIRVLEKAERSLVDGDLDYLKGKMKKAYKKMPDEYFLMNGAVHSSIYSIGGAEDGIRRHIKWAKEPFEQSTYHLEGRKYPTSAGFNVRSKSEQHIVEQLVNYGVPFRYEQVIRIDNIILVPDATFRGKDMNLFYWEHAGMMNDPGYCARHKRKMELLEQGGIVPWKNLIVTYDINDYINVPMIKSIIENEIIPRL